MGQAVELAEHADSAPDRSRRGFGICDVADDCFRPAAAGSGLRRRLVERLGRAVDHYDRLSFFGERQSDSLADAHRGPGDDNGHVLLPLLYTTIRWYPQGPHPRI